MTKAEYLEQLSQRLSALPRGERRDALEYYDGYLSDAEDEAAAIARLGAPGEVAADILAEHVAKGPAVSKAGANGIKTAWMVALAVFALPVGLPVAIALAASVLALFVVLLAVILALGAGGLGSLLAGMAGLIMFPLTVAQSAALALIAGGAGLISLGLGILLIKCAAALLMGFPAIARFAGKKIAGRKRHGK